MLETITHEFAGHLYKYNEIIKAYEKEHKYKDANSEWKKATEHEEHLRMQEKDSDYQKVINELLIALPHLKDKFIFQDE